MKIAVAKNDSDIYRDWLRNTSFFLISNTAILVDRYVKTGSSRITNSTINIKITSVDKYPEIL